MNIFVLDRDPVMAAKYHCDKHLKMILESAQMLSTCIRHLGVNDDVLYQKFNPKHPCNLWLMESRENVKWLLTMCDQLGQENFTRNGKHHKSMSIVKHAEKYLDVFPNKPFTPFKLAMFPQFMTDDPIHSYRLFYAGAKYKFAKWKTTPPAWWDEYRAFVKSHNLEVENDKDDGVKVHA
jgi:hypothetical protein